MGDAPTGNLDYVIGNFSMLKGYLKTVRLFNRNVRLFLVFMALRGFSLQGVFFVLSSLYLLRMGFGPDTVGLVFALGWGTCAIFSLPAGALARRWGVRRTMIAGLGVLAISVVLQPLGVFRSETVQLSWFLALWVLYGIGTGAYLANTPPFLTGSTGEEERAHAFSVWAGIGALSAFAGGLAGGWLPDLFSNQLDLSLDHPAPFRYTLIIAGVVFLVGVLVLLATAEVAGGSRKEATDEVGPPPLGLIGLLAAAFLLQTTGEAVVMQFFSA